MISQIFSSSLITLATSRSTTLMSQLGNVPIRTIFWGWKIEIRLYSKINKFWNSAYTLWIRLHYYTPKMGGLRWQWISHKMNIRHSGQSKKLKSWGPFWRAPPIWPIWPIFEVNGLDWHCSLAGSSKTAPRILIFSIALGANSSYEIKKTSEI